jgi:hypothetical protein
VRNLYRAATSDLEILTSAGLVSVLFRACFAAVFGQRVDGRKLRPNASRGGTKRGTTWRTDNPPVDQE